MRAGAGSPRAAPGSADAPQSTYMSIRVPISFKSALARFRGQCDEVAPQAGALDAADQAHLARWADDDRAERVWRKIQSLAWDPVGSYNPLEGFIPMILVARQLATSADATDRIALRHRMRCARHLERAERLEALAKTWKEIADSDDPRAVLALKRAEMYEEEAQAWRRLAQKPLPARPFLTSRVDRDGSRKQRAFMQLTGDYLKDLCGRSLDSEVAALNDIAFDTPDATSTFKARSARRPTTRQGRSRRDRQPKKHSARAKSA